MASLQFPFLITVTLPILRNWKNSEPVTAKSRLSAKKEELSLEGENGLGYKMDAFIHFGGETLELQ